MARKNKNNQWSVKSATLGLTDDRAIASAGKHSTAAVTAAQTEASATAAAVPSFWKKLGGGERFAVAAVVLLLALSAFGAGMNYLEQSAKSERAANSQKLPREQEHSLLSKVNPFAAAPPPPAATPQLSKEYIYAGSRMLAVEDANANAAPPADLAVWRQSTGYWYVLGGQGSAQTSFQWGGMDDEAVPGDYDGDGKTDFAVWRHTNGTWYISTSSSGGASYTATQFGIGNSDKAVPADYDGDGKTDLAVFRPSTGYWYIQRSSDPTIIDSYYFGGANDDPAPADYDGDGKADVAVWSGTGYTLSIIRSLDHQPQQQTIYSGAVPGDKPVSADYDGDGKADFAVRHGSNWLIRYSASTYANATDVTVVPWQAGDFAVQNDYDGDGKVDIAVWNAASGNWYIRQSSLNGQLRQVQWGGIVNGTADIPVPAFYRR